MLSDILGGDPDQVNKEIEGEVDRKLLNSAIDKLTNREKNIMELRFGLKSGKEKTQKEESSTQENHKERTVNTNINTWM